MIAARDIMTTAPRCIGADETLVDAAKTMDQLDVGALPVCGEGRTLVGMLTDRDIVVRCIARGSDPATTRAGELARRPLVSVGVGDDVQDVLRTMNTHQLRRLLVIEGHDLVGIISRADIARRTPHADAVRALTDIPL